MINCRTLRHVVNCGLVVHVLAHVVPHVLAHVLGHGIHVRIEALLRQVIGFFF